MRILGLMVALAGVAIGGFAVALGFYLESGHSGSALRNAGRRISLAFRDEPAMREISQNVFREVADAFAWLDLAFLALLVAALALILCGILIALLVRHPDPERLPRR